MNYVNSKIRDWDGLLSFVEYARNKKDLFGNNKIVFTNGCFDLIHAGHISILSKAKQYGRYLVVGINSDESVKKIKGDLRPILNDKQRALIVSAFEFVDCVYIFSEETPIKIIESINPDVLVKGGDWDIERIVGADHVISRGGSVHSIHSEYKISTTNIISDIVNKFST